MSDADKTPAGEDAWAEARRRYEQTSDTLSSIAARLGLHHNQLRRQAASLGWTLRMAGARKPSTRATLMKLRETLQARIAQFEQQIAELGKEVDALGNEKEARAMNLLVRTLEKVLDLERKHTQQNRKRRDQAKRLDDAAREELVRRIEALAPREESEGLRQATGPTARSPPDCMSGLYAAPAGPGRLASATAAPVYGKPAAAIMDLAISVSDNAAAPWIAATADPWPGALALLRETGPSSFALDRLVEAQATMGRALTALPAGRRHLFDHANTIDVELAFGALSSAGELEVLNGANIAALGDAEGGYEVLQFCSAQLIGPRTWRLSKLLRAQGGSDPEMLPLRPAGATFVLLNGAVSQASLAAVDALKPASWRLGPARLDHGHPSYRSLTTAAGGRGLRPLSPAHLSVQRQGADILVSWIRRTRSDGDSWELVEVPLGEQGEAYRIAIYDGATLKRTAETSSPAYAYSAADLATDFTAPPAQVTIAVAQMSALTGQGAQTWGTFNV